MINFSDIIGREFGRLLVKEYLGPNPHSYLCECVCGKQVKAFRDRLLAGRVKSCGCLQKDSVTKHGGTVRDGSRYSASYRSWESIKLRCDNKNHKDYKNYGARGISYCKEWESFEGFYKDMGDRPVGTTIGRKDNNGPYCKENCQWETPEQQQNNTRHNVFIEGASLKEVAEATKINYNTIELRKFRGATLEEIKNTPYGKRRASVLKDFSEVIGTRNERLVVREVFKKEVKGQTQVWYKCECDCGNFKEVLRGNFSKVKSCGCYRKEHLLEVRAEGKSWKNRKKEVEESS